MGRRYFKCEQIILMLNKKARAPILSVTTTPNSITSASTNWRQGLCAPVTARRPWLKKDYRKKQPTISVSYTTGRRPPENGLDASKFSLESGQLKSGIPRQNTMQSFFENDPAHASA